MSWECNLGNHTLAQEQLWEWHFKGLGVNAHAQSSVELQDAVNARAQFRANTR